MKAHVTSWVCGAVVTLGSLVAAIPGPSLASTRNLAAIFPPWWTQAQVIQAAASAGHLVDVGAWPSTVIVEFTDEGLPSRLRSGGALIVVDAAIFGCGTPNP